MSRTPCFTVDVEDFYEGMHTLGHDPQRPAGSEPGLAVLQGVLKTGSARVTLFVVGRHAAASADILRTLSADGHEIASHGPDHGRLPEGERELTDWLRAGRQMVEDAVGVKVEGFRSPRFDIPAKTSLEAFRDAIAEAGFSYVSDRSMVGDASPVAEIPVAVAWRVPYGGGSYQRLMPSRAVSSLVRRSRAPCVLYYHSYDFGRELPALRSVRSRAVLAQVLGRGRIAQTFERLLHELGSRTCREAMHALR